MSSSTKLVIASMGLLFIAAIPYFLLQRPFVGDEYKDMEPDSITGDMESKAMSQIIEGLNVGCVDDSSGWLDDDGNGCGWYAIGNNCQMHGEKFDSVGKKANEVCCVCGGGNQSKELTLFETSVCSSSTPCGVCQGTCDSDSHCAGNLKCFQRDGLTSIPGCDGSGIPDWNYCHDPIASNTALNNGRILTSLETIECSASNPCDLCQGDCDSDSECAGNLKCFQRDGYTTVPGCAGLGKESRDYCYHAPLSNGLDLESFGGSGCTSSEPCGMCQGDCDSDSDCEGTLKCFERDGYTSVPGCSGFGEDNYDYCYDPTPSKTLKTIGGSRCTSSKPCDLCQGDCDSDSGCQGDLKCFQRDGYTSVPGCGGNGHKDYDYCYDPTSTNVLEIISTFGCSTSNLCGLCEGDCDSDSECEGDLKCFQRDGYTPVPGCGGLGQKDRDFCYDPMQIPLTSFGISGCTSSDPCDLCEGDCDYDSQCAGNLRCFQRDWFTPIPGCAGTGHKDYDYCYDPKSDHLLETVGGSGCTTFEPCGFCEGDCDSDSECSGDLRCFQRDGYTPVPGCGAFGGQDYDYCYDPQLPPLSKRRIHLCSSIPCGLCEGECDYDSECLGTLRCFQRDGFMKVPGCAGAGVSGDDYCYDPTSVNFLEIIGGSGCTSSEPCGACQGACDSDSECIENLKCFQRDGFRSVPGCGGLGDMDSNYCFEPAT